MADTRQILTVKVYHSSWESSCELASKADVLHDDYDVAVVLWWLCLHRYPSLENTLLSIFSLVFFVAVDTIELLCLVWEANQTHGSLSGAAVLAGP